MATMTRTREEAISLNLFELAMEQQDAPKPLAGLDAAVVATDPGTGSATFLARLPARWEHTSDTAEATLELFLTSA